MDKQEIYIGLTSSNKDLKVLLDEPMSKHTSFKIGGNADIFVKATTIEDVKYVLSFINTNSIPLTLIGNGSNLLVKDGGIRGITLQVSLDEIEIKENIVNVGCGVKLGMLAGMLQKEGLSGFEFASGIPGCIGGAIRMNAGAYGSEFKDIVEEIRYITKNGKIETIQNSEANFSYRHSKFCETEDIILSAKLKLEKASPDEIMKKMQENLEHRMEKQPLNFPSAGSTFKRGDDFITAKLIDEAGLKGYKIGGAEVSEKHAGFIVNTSNATAKDVIELIEYVKKIIKEKYNKNIELELEIIGED